MTTLSRKDAIAALQEGKTASIKCSGNSMRPRIVTKSLVTLEPCTAEDVAVGDALLCKVRGNVYVHLATAIKGGKGKRQIQISNNHGHVTKVEKP